MSEEKIIARRNKLIEWTKTQDIRCTPFCETINENINSINYLLYELQQKENIIKEVREKVNKTLNVNSDYVDYDFGVELLRQEFLEILDKESEVII